MITAKVILLITAVLTTLANSRMPLFYAIAIVCGIAAYAAIPFALTEVQAQDLGSYVSWHESAGSFDRGDVGFELLLLLLPNDVTPSFISAYLGIIVVLLTGALCHRVGALFEVGNTLRLLAFTLILTDRFFLDFAFNTVRSTISILLLFMAFIDPSVTRRMLIGFFGVSVHYFAGIFVVLLYLLTLVLKNTKGFLKAPLLIFFSAAIAKYFFGIYPISSFSESLMIVGFDQTLTRATSYAVNTYSHSLFVQMLLLAGVPVIYFLMKKEVLTKPMLISTGNNLQLAKMVTTLSVLILCFFFFTYPEFSLSLRFILPAALVLLLVTIRKLYVLLLFLKVTSLVAFL